jgi:hypothetical protein
VKVSEVRILVACSSTSTTPALLPLFASRCQLALPVPSPLARELTPRRRCAPRRSLRVPLPPPPVACVPGAPSPTLFCATAAAAALQLPPPPAQHQPPPPARITSVTHRLRPVPSGTRAAQCRRRCAPSPLPPRSTRVPPPPPPKHVPRDPAPGTPRAAATAAAPVAAFTLLGNELPPPARASGLRPPLGTHAAAAAALASPIPRRPRECRRRRRCSCCVPRVSPPPARLLPPPLPPLPRLLQPDNRVGIGHRHLPRHQIRALLAIVCRALPTARGRPRALILISSSPSSGTEACQYIYTYLMLKLCL